MKKSTLSIVLIVTLLSTSKAQIPNAGFENFSTLGAYEVPIGWGTMNNKTKIVSIYTATKGTPGSPGSSYLKLTSKTLSASIPNAGFESFANLGSYELPNGWGTMNNKTAIVGIYTATKGTPGSPGSSYLKLTSKTTGTTVVNGIAVSGVLDSIAMKAKSGFAINMQPTSLTGKWQHMIYGSSQGSVKAVLTKWNTTSNKRDTVAIASQILAGMAMSWANFSINFTYLSANIPDSCIIDLRASGNNPTNNDYLWVDNLAFAGSEVFNGIAVSGVLDTISMIAKSGFAFNMQPLSLTGNWQHMIYGSSQGSVKAFLTKWNAGLNKRDTVAIASQILAGIVTSWENFSINFNYLSDVIPDSCIIDLRASGSTPTNNDYLWVDNLAFNGTVTNIANHNSMVNNFIVFPNPANETINVNLNLKSIQKVMFEIIDITGKVILKKDSGFLNGETIQILNINTLAKGQYLVKVILEAGTESRKLIIQ